jgi:hypothetical protein
MRSLLRRFGVLAVVSLSVVALACTETASITQIPIVPVVPVVDTAAPTATVAAPAATLEAGDSLTVTYHDDVRLARAHVLLLDSLNRVVWRSPMVSLPATGTADTGAVAGYSVTQRVALTALPDTFPFGTKLNAVAWVQDASGRATYGPAKGVVDSTKATTVPVTVGDGRTVSLATGSKIGALAYDSAGHVVYFTDGPKNAVRGLMTVDATVAPWSILVGSNPKILAYQRTAFGNRPTLAVFNSGGTSVSIVDLTTAGGGQQRAELPLPVLKATVGTDTIPLDFTANSALFYCPDRACQVPTFYIGNLQRGSAVGTAKGVIRSISLTSPDQLANFSVLAPDYSGVLPTDKAVTVTVTESSRATQQDSVIYTKANASQCGTLSFGSTVVQSSDDPGGPLFVAETGQSGGACGTGGRVLRFDRTPTGGYKVDPQAVFNYDVDPTVRSISAVAVNADASLVLLVAADKVFLTDGTLRRLATITGSGITGAAFLSGQRGGAAALAAGGVFAISSSSGGVRVYETEHYTQVAHYTPANAITGAPLFVRTDAIGGVLLLGPAKDGTAFTVVRTSLAAMAVRTIP